MKKQLTTTQEREILNTFKDIFSLAWIDDRSADITESQLQLDDLLKIRTHSAEPIIVTLETFRLTFSASLRSPYAPGQIGINETRVIDVPGREIDGDGLQRIAFLYASCIEGIVAGTIVPIKTLERKKDFPRRRLLPLIRYAFSHGREVNVWIDPLRGISVVVRVSPTEISMDDLEIDESPFTFENGDINCIMRWDLSE